MARPAAALTDGGAAEERLPFFLAADDVKAAAEAWYRWLKKEKRFAAHTLRAYGQDLAGFLAFLAEHLGQAATLDDLPGMRQRAFPAHLSRRRNDGLAATSLARSLRAVRSFFPRLPRDGLNHNAPAKIGRAECTASMGPDV